MDEAHLYNSSSRCATKGSRASMTALAESLGSREWQVRMTAQFSLHGVFRYCFALLFFAGRFSLLVELEKFEGL